MLFTLYEAKPATIDEYADALVQKSTAANFVDVSALKAKARAAEQVDGELADLLDEPFKSVGKDSKQIALASAFAAGVLYDWSAAITTFNDGVEKLNTEYEQKKAANFGVPDAPAGPSGGLSPGALEAEHAKAVKGAEAALIADLKDRWSKLDDTLDSKASSVNGELKEGPSEENVLELFAGGDLPETAFPLLSAVGIDPKQAASILADLRAFIGGTEGSGSRTQKSAEAWFRMLETLKQTDPKAAAVILGALSDAELRALGREIGDSSAHMADASDFYSFVLAGATREQVDRLKKLWALNPAGQEGWKDPGAWPPLFSSSDKGVTNIGAAQGQVGDCWMLARLNAIAGSDPSWPREHVRENDNGTVSVKFYNDDGDPYWVTVTDEVPDEAASPTGTNAANWAVYYEKAMAADDHGRPGSGYDSLGLGFNRTADIYMTGKDVDTKSILSSGDAYEAAVEAHEEHKGVVASNALNNPLDAGDNALQQRHIYYVKDIEADGDVVLGNPWGKEDVTLTKEQFNAYMDEVSVVNS